MKTTTEIIKHFLKLYYLDLATDGKISFQELEAKSNKGEEISAGDFCFGYIDRGYENLTEIPIRINAVFPALPSKERMHLYQMSETFFDEFDSSDGLIDAENLFSAINKYSEQTFFEKDFEYDLQDWK
ncbi:hypothetical protein [Kaistella yonginensis]|uniref:hypothetical protein n=1 Tax=Kaistella yonginensis TaxID=658267 RepID=UPI0025B59D7F|nr:hypothetical protein [Kaistella yonginensis]MDN3607195.1 hypothetical protein [Kaistella yonginensis]